MRRQMGVESEDSTQTAQARTFAVSRDCGSNERIQKTFTAETRRLWCVFLPVMWLTQFAEELHSQRSVDEEEQHEEESKISHLESKCIIDLSAHYYYILKHNTTCLKVQGIKGVRSFPLLPFETN